MTDPREQIDRLKDFERVLVRDITFLLDDQHDDLLRARDDVARSPGSAAHAVTATTVRRNQDRWKRLLSDRRTALEVDHPAEPPDQQPDDTSEVDRPDRSFYREYRHRLLDELDRAERELVTRPEPLPQGAGPLSAGDLSRLLEQHERACSRLYPHRYGSPRA